MMPTGDPRDAPDPAFIARMRTDYPMEPDVDRVLTRRLSRRAQDTKSFVGLDRLQDALERMLSTKIGDFRISDAAWLSGGASKMQMRFKLHWDDPETGQTATDLVVRMEPPESLNASSREREFEVLRDLAGIVPVPRVYWVDPDGTWFPEPALVYGFSPGVAKPSVGRRGTVTGIGTYYPPELRALLGPQFVENLAKVHSHPVDAARLPSFDIPETGTTQSAQWQVNRGCRIWEEDRGEAMPVMNVAANWLNRNLPKLDVVSMNHGDYRAGNFLFEEETGRVTTILDWERAYVGDRHRDLAWSSSRILGHLDEAGKDFLICGLVPEAEFYDRYQELSGLSVDPDRLHYYRILTRYQQVQTVLGTAYRVVRLGKSHQCIVVARLEAVAYTLAEELRGSLAEVL